MSAERGSTHRTPSMLIDQMLVQPTGLAVFTERNGIPTRQKVLERNKRTIQDFTQIEVEEFARFLIKGLTLDDEFWTSKRRSGALELYTLIDHIRIPNTPDILQEAISNLAFRSYEQAVLVIKAVEASSRSITPEEFDKLFRSLIILKNFYHREEYEKLSQLIDEIQRPKRGEKEETLQTFLLAKRRKEKINR